MMKYKILEQVVEFHEIELEYSTGMFNVVCGKLIIHFHYYV